MNVDFTVAAGASRIHQRHPRRRRYSLRRIEKQQARLAQRNSAPRELAGRRTGISHESSQRFPFVRAGLRIGRPAAADSRPADACSIARNPSAVRQVSFSITVLPSTSFTTTFASPTLRDEVHRHREWRWKADDSSVEMLLLRAAVPPRASAPPVYKRNVRHWERQGASSPQTWTVEEYAGCGRPLAKRR